MTERERKILMGESIEPRTADENAYANVGGSAEPLVVTLTATNLSSGTFAEDFGGIIDGLSSGKPILFNLWTGGKITLCATWTDKNTEIQTTPFQFMSNLYYLKLFTDNTWSLVAAVSG